MLHLQAGDVGRFRDAFISNGEIAIYTRNGGGNRDCWDDEKKEDCRCPGCIIGNILPKHPNYLRDEDDDFDSTYATIYFSIPDEVKELAEKLDTGTFEPDARWTDKLDGLKYESPESLRSKYPELCGVMDKILKQLQEST